MTQLLVSVRNASEAVAALAGGADIIDVKEPTRGSLGMADAGAIEGVVGAVEGRRPVSAALGELYELCDRNLLLSKNGDSGVPQLPAGLTYAKIGLAGQSATDDWVHDWMQFRSAVETNMPVRPRWIAVAYVDWRSSDSPSPTEVIQAAVQTNCAGVLFDTCSKSNGILLDWLPMPELSQSLEAIREAGLLAALAGGIRESEAAALTATGADILAIRTAACDGGRNGTVTASAVRRFRAAMDSAQPTAAAASPRPAD